MKKFFLKDFFKGWIVGNFEPSLYKSSNFEVAIQTYRAGDQEEQHYHKVGTEISLLVVGEAAFNDEIIKEGEGVVIKPKESNIFKAITDCKVLVIKYPSDTNDKYFGEYID